MRVRTRNDGPAGAADPSPSEIVSESAAPDATGGEKKSGNEGKKGTERPRATATVLNCKPDHGGILNARLMGNVLRE